MSALPNIPPFWSALAYWLACLLYVFMLPRRWGRARTACAAAALLAGLAAYLALTANWQGWRFNIGMLGTAALNALTFFVLSRVTWRSAVYYCARAFILGGFTASLAWQLYALMVLPHFDTANIPSEAATMLPLYAA